MKVATKDVATQEYVDTKVNTARDILTGELNTVEIATYTALAGTIAGGVMDVIFGLALKYCFTSCRTLNDTVPSHGTQLGNRLQEIATLYTWLDYPPLVRSGDATVCPASKLSDLYLQNGMIINDQAGVGGVQYLSLIHI